MPDTFLGYLGGSVRGPPPHAGYPGVAPLPRVTTLRLRLAIEHVDFSRHNAVGFDSCTSPPGVVPRIVPSKCGSATETCRKTRRSGTVCGNTMSGCVAGASLKSLLLTPTQL